MCERTVFGDIFYNFVQCCQEVLHDVGFSVWEEDLLCVMSDKVREFVKRMTF